MNLSKEKLRKILSAIEIIKNDCQAQHDKLIYQNDIDWNPYDPECWRTLIDVCDSVVDELEPID